MDVPFESGSWNWGTSARTETEHAGRRCIRFDAEEASLETVAGLDFQDGALEVELAVGPERAFPGVVWRVQDEDNCESFFVRPHQVGNDDAIQYTPVFNGSSAWQLYHGPGFWSPVAFPIDDWFTIRVVFAGDVAEIFVVGLDEPTLVVRQRRPAHEGRVGLLASGDGLHVARFAVDPDARPSHASPPEEPFVEGAIPGWSVSEPFAEGSSPVPVELGWTHLDAEPSGLANLARVHATSDGRNTVYARTVIRAERAGTNELVFGFSDRAVVSLNGRPLYRGDYTYRSRDYRFLGGIGYWDSLFLPLEVGDNELLVAVSEDFGGWGVQARFPEPSGLTFG
jgi:hypothetical protein